MPTCMEASQAGGYETHNQNYMGQEEVLRHTHEGPKISNYPQSIHK